MGCTIMHIVLISVKTVWKSRVKRFVHHPIQQKKMESDTESYYTSNTELENKVRGCKNTNAERSIKYKHISGNSKGKMSTTPVTSLHTLLFKSHFARICSNLQKCTSHVANINEARLVTV